MGKVSRTSKGEAARQDCVGDGEEQGNSDDSDESKAVARGEQ